MIRYFKRLNKEFNSYRKKHPAEFSRYLTIAFCGLVLLGIGMTFGSLFLFAKAALSLYASGLYNVNYAVLSGVATVAGNILPAAQATTSGVFYFGSAAVATLAAAKYYVAFLSASIIGAGLLAIPILNGIKGMYNVYRTEDVQHTSNNPPLHPKSATKKKVPPELRDYPKPPYSGLHSMATKRSKSTTSDDKKPPKRRSRPPSPSE